MMQQIPQLIHGRHLAPKHSSGGLDSSYPPVAHSHLLARQTHELLLAGDSEIASLLELDDHGTGVVALQSLECLIGGVSQVCLLLSCGVVSSTLLLRVLANAQLASVSS